MSQMRMVLSAQPEARRLPSGLSVTPETMLPWGKVAISWSVSADQSLTLGGGEQFAVLAPGHAVNNIGVAAQTCQWLGGIAGEEVAHAPQVQHAVAADGCQRPAVGAKRHIAGKSICIFV